jgi:predicted alpha/beta hydrolase
MDPEALLDLIVGLAVGNGAALYLCVTGSGANAIPQYLLKALIMVVLLIDVVIPLLALFMRSKFPKRGSGTIVYD